MAEEKILIRVQKLLDKANDPSVTPEERQTFIEGADRLMVKHAIDAAMLNATLTATERRRPVTEKFQAVNPNSEYWERFRTVLRMIGQAHNVRMAFHYDGDVTMVGFRDDVEYVKMKWLSVYLQFTKTIDPTWDLNLTIDHNVYNFKTAGHRWEDIQSVMFGVTGIDKPLHFFKPSYRRHCKVIGEEPRPHTQRNHAYRNSFTEGFVLQICARIEGMMAEKRVTESEAGAVVLMRDVQVEIDEAFYDLFPGRRPKTEAEMAEIRRRLAEQDAEEARREAERLERMTPEERKAFERERERQRRQDAKDNDRYWRNQSKRYDAEGASLGADSANKVDLSRNAETSAANRKEL
jgi:hypothetical protein